MKRRQPSLLAHREAALSPRERQVLDGYVAGKSDSAIAAELGNSVLTVRTIAQTVRTKFDVSRMSDIVAGVKAGTYTIRRSEDRFNLSSAVQIIDARLATLQERRRQTPRTGSRISVLLHELELEALSLVGHSVLDTAPKPRDVQT